MIKKFYFYFIFFFPALALAQDIFLKDQKIQYLHVDKEGEIVGNTMEYHFQADDLKYTFSRVYNKQDKLYKKRSLKFDKSGKLLVFYEKDFRNNIITFYNYLDSENIFYMKKNKIKKEKSKNIFITYPELNIYILKKILNNSFKKEIIKTFIPHNALINTTNLTLECLKNNQNPYLGKKEPVIICNVLPKSRIIKLLAKEKAKLILVFSQEDPRYLLSLIVGENKFYIESYSKIEKKEQLFSEITQIEKDIQKIFLEKNSSF